MRMRFSMCGRDVSKPSNRQAVLAGRRVGVCFTVPFILLSGYAGQFADRNSKRFVSVLVKAIEIPIGLGSAVAGLISGHRIEPRLIPIGAAGLTVFFILLGIVSPVLPEWCPMWRVAFSNVSGLIFGAGFFAGFYIIPLQALLQKLSPDDERGRFLGTANAVSLSFLTGSAALYWLMRPAFDEVPQRIFLVSAGLMAVGAAFFLWRLGLATFSKRGPNMADGLQEN